MLFIIAGGILPDNVRNRCENNWIFK